MAKFCRIVAVAGLAFFATAATGQSAETVRVTALLGMTGPLASIDVPTANGIRLAVQKINGAGGFTVAGKKYQLDIAIEDIQGKPDQAVGMARKLVSEKKVSAILGPVASSLAVPTLEITQPKMLQLTPATIAQQYVGQPGKELLFDTLNPQYGADGISPKYLEWLDKNIIKPHNIKRIAVLLPNDSFGQLQLDFFPPAFKKLGVEITDQESFDPKSADFSARITKLKGGRPDALFWGYSDEVGKTIIRQSIEQGLTTKFIAAPGPSGASAIDQADKIEFAVWPSSVPSLFNPSPKMQEFVTAYEKLVGRTITPGDQFALYLHDSVGLLVQAMEKAGTTTDHQKIAAALRGMHYSGVADVSVDTKGQFHTDWDVGRMKRGGTISWTTVKAQ